MVMNLHTYPNLLRIFAETGVEIEESDMSFSCWSPKTDTEDAFSWAFKGGLDWVLRNVWRPRLWKFAIAHSYFCRVSSAFLANPKAFSEDPHLTLRQLIALIPTLDVEGCVQGKPLDPVFVDRWLVPFVSAVWSAPENNALDCAAFSILRFMNNHQFLTLGTMQWFTPKSRSHTYVEKVLTACRNLAQQHGRKFTIKTGSAATALDAAASGSTQKSALVLANGDRVPYDAIVMACHAPTQLALMKTLQSDEPKLKPALKWLSSFKTFESRVVGHQDESFMPPHKPDWTSWNVALEGIAHDTEKDSAGVRVTYWISRLQNLKAQNIFVTLNPDPNNMPKDVFFDENLNHPSMDAHVFEGQNQHTQHQGVCNVFFAGAWLRNGFHEDGATSGLLAVRKALLAVGSSRGECVPVAYPSAPTGIIEPVAIRGTTSHTRYFPQKKTFSADLFEHKFDLRAPPHGYMRKDHFGNPEIPLDTCVRQALSERIQFYPVGKIMCICNLRYLRCCFNPITTYYCYDETGTKLEAILAEVHNTPWLERCLYAMRVSDNEKGERKVLTPKTHLKIMHVSPFNPPPAACDKDTVPTSHNIVENEEGNSRDKGCAEAANVVDDAAINAGPSKGRDGTPSKLVASKQEDTIYEYDFRLGDETPFEDRIDLHVYKKESGTRTKTMEITMLTPEREHDVKTGSWRAITIVYMHAIDLLRRGVPMAAYEDHPVEMVRAH
jgi:predicted NAD/FAD-binding protein/DUF1365 family protein